MHSVRGSGPTTRHRTQKIFFTGTPRDGYRSVHALHTLHMPCPPQPMVRKVPGRTTPPHPRSRNCAVFLGLALRHAHCELHLLTAAARQEAEAHRRVKLVVKAAAERRGMCRLRGIWRERQHQQADPEPAPGPGRLHVGTAQRALFKPFPGGRFHLNEFARDVYLALSHSCAWKAQGPLLDVVSPRDDSTGRLRGGEGPLGAPLVFACGACSPAPGAGRARQERLRHTRLWVTVNGLGRQGRRSRLVPPAAGQ